MSSYPPPSAQCGTELVRQKITFKRASDLRLLPCRNLIEIEKKEALINRLIEPVLIKIAKGLMYMTQFAELASDGEVKCLETKVIYISLPISTFTSVSSNGVWHHLVKLQ